MTLFGRTGTLLLMAVPLSCFSCGGDGVIALLSGTADGHGLVGGGGAGSGPTDDTAGGAGSAGVAAGGASGSTDSPPWRRSCSEPGDPECPPEARYCEGSSGLCAECVDDSDCWMSPSGLKECAVSIGQCVECRTTEDWFSSDEFCDVGRTKCVRCVDDSLCTIPTTACNRDKGECALPCLSADDCTSLLEPFCDLSLGLCVECLTTSDCVGGQACTTHSRECVSIF